MNSRVFVILCLALSLLTHPSSAAVNEIATAISNLEFSKVKKFVDASRTNRDIALAYASDPTGHAAPNDPRNVAFIKYLLGRGADPNSDRGDGPAFSWIMEWPQFNSGLASLMLRHGARISAETMMCAALGGRDPVRWLVNHGCSVNIRDSNGQTAVFIAAADDNAAEIEYLVAHGAQINVHDHDGMSPLMIAAKTSEDYPYGVEALHSLIIHGANVNARGIGGMTALMYLSHRGDYPLTQDIDPDDAAIVCAKDLVAHGARVDLKDVYGHTAEQLAEKYEMKGLARYLRSVEAGRNKMSNPSRSVRRQMPA